MRTSAGESTALLHGSDQHFLYDSGSQDSQELPKQSVDPFEKWADKRTRILLLVGLPAIMPPMVASMYLPALNYIREDLNTTNELLALTVSLYTLVVGFMPLIWGPLSDSFGRKRVLLLSLSIFIITDFLCGFAPDIYYLIAWRVVQGFGLSASGVVGAGCIADTFPPAVRGTAMGWFSVTALMGVFLGPVFGGFIAQFVGWRAIFFTLGAIGILLFISDFIFLPETLNPNAERRPFNPVRPFLFLFIPPILAVASMAALIFSTMYLTIFVFPLKLGEVYGLNEMEIGLSYIPFGVCALTGVYLGGHWTDYSFSIFGSGGRLISSVIACFFVALSYAFFGWMVETNFYWCLVSTGFIGLFSSLGRPGVSTFAIDRRPTEASSVSASIFSFQFSASFVTLTSGPYLIDAYSVQSTFLGLAIILLILCIPAGVVCYLYSSKKEIK